MPRRTITIIAFVVAVLLTVIGAHYCNHKILPLIRLALWFPLPYLLHADSIPGVLLALVQFPLLAGIFALAIRHWRARSVLIEFLIVYALYAATVIAIIGSPR